MVEEDEQGESVDNTKTWWKKTNKENQSITLKHGGRR
jgi:hypothetical protein